ncbi:MAG: PKD domain-containing protein [Breznakibacter sp.]
MRKALLLQFVERWLNVRLWSIVFALWMLGTGWANAQVTACANGVITGSSVLGAASVPTGHRNDGYWSQTSGLVFSSLTDPNATISGFVAGQTYTIEWTYKNSIQKYVYTFTASSASVPAAGLTVNGSANDVLLCFDSNVSLEPSPSGQSAYEYFVANSTSGTLTSVATSGSSSAYNLTTGNYEPLDNVFVVVTAANGCKQKSNEITVSTVDDVKVQVVGDGSVCPLAPTPPYQKLEVVPFSSGGDFTYVWHMPLGMMATNVQSVDITVAGQYYVEVTSTNSSCPGVTVSNTVNVTTASLPTITIDASDFCASGSSTATISSSVSGGTLLSYRWEWLRNGTLDASLGTGSTVATDVSGSYQARLISTTDEQCFEESNIETVETVQISATLAALNGPFCGSGIPSAVMNFTGGTGPYTVVLSANGVNQASRQVISGTAFSLGTITSTTTYAVVSVTDATGCAMNTSALPSAITYTVSVSPSTYNMTGTSVCEGTTATIGLSNSQAGVTYVLRRNLNGVITNVETVTRSASGSFTFSTHPSVAGTYYVVAYTTDCPTEITMSGTVAITAVPQAQTMTGPSGTLCSGTAVIFGLGASESDVTYSLYRGSTLVETISGDVLGGPIYFSGQTQVGNYTVRATRGACSSVVMSGSFTIVKSPTVYSVSGGTACEDVGITIGLSGSESGVTYSLYRDGTLVTTRVNDGNFGLQSTPGVYTIRAMVNGCAADMTGSARVNALPNDVPFAQTGIVCPYGTISLPSPTQSGVRYILYRGSSPTGLAITSTGGAVNFGTQTTPGEYWVEAVNLTTGCRRELSDRLTIQAEPSILTLQASGTTYCNAASLSGINLTVNSSQENVNYQLLRNGVSYGGVMVGNGGTLTWPNVVDGSYTLVAYNDGGCSVTMNGNPIIVAASAPTATISAQIPNRRCANSSETFKITVTLTGIPPFNFQINDNKGSAPIQVTGHPTTTYTLDVNPSSSTIYTLSNLTDAANCSAVNGTGSAQFYVDELPDITFSPASPQVCAGSSISVTASGAGTGGSYTWSNNLGTNPTITVSPAVTTIYTVMATTQYGCTASKSITVTVNPLPTVDFTTPGNDYVFCSNDAQVVLTGNPSGGTFSNLTGSSGIILGSNIFDPSQAQIGNNYVVYSYADVNGCTNTVVKNLVVNRTPTVNLYGLNASYCGDVGSVTLYGNPQNSNGDFTLIGYGEPTSFYTDNHNGTATFSPSGALNATGSGAYQFRYTYTDPTTGCSAYVEASTVVYPDLNITLSFSGLPSNPCQDDTNVYMLTGSEAPAGTFSGPGITDNGNGTATFNPSVAGNGTHTITYSYTDPVTQCSGSTSQTITVGTNLTANINGLYCKSDVAVTLQGNPSGGIFTIKNSSGTILSSGADGTVVFNPQVLPNDTYSIEYSLTINGCDNVRVWPVILTALPDAGFATDSPNPGYTQFCRSVTSVTLKPNGPQGVFSGPGVSGNLFSPAVAGPGNHTIRHTVSTGSCTEWDELTLSVIDYDNIWIDNLADSYCDNQTAPILIEANNKGVSGGKYTFRSTTNAVNRSPLYYLDVDGVTKVYDTEIVDKPVYFDPTRVGDGYYSVTYEFDNTANNGCVSSYSKTVRVYPAVGVNFGGLADPIQYCHDDMAVTLEGSFLGSGVFTGSGSFAGNGITDSNPNDGIAIFDPGSVSVGLHPITYTYTAPVAQGGCVSIRTKNIEVLDAPNVYNITPLSSVPYAGHYCHDGTGVTIGVDFSQVGVTYELILNGNTGTPVQTQSGDGDAIEFPAPVKVSGIYTVLARHNGSSCTVQMNGSVEVAMNQVAVSVVVQDVSCKSGSDGKITINASSAPGESLPYLYSIDGGANWSASNEFAGLLIGSYQVTVKNAIGCTIPSAVSVNIGEPANALNVTLVDTKPVGCLTCTTGGTCEGQILVSITGGTPFTDPVIYPEGYDIQWQNSVSAPVGNDSALLTLQPPGNYTVTVTDAKGCTVSLVATIGMLTPLSITKDPDVAKHIDNKCHGGLEGSFKVLATGGSGKYQFSIDNANWFDEVNDTDNFYEFENLPADTYKVYVRDKLYPRCVAQLGNDVEILQPAAIVTTLIDKQDISCHDEEDGWFQVAASGGGSGVYYYSIDGIDFTNTSGLFNSLKVGTYQVLVKDGSDCLVADLAPVVIANPTQIAIALKIDKHVGCRSGNDGEVSSTVTGGTGTYSYAWKKAPAYSTVIGNTATITGVSAGTYWLVVTDARGCTDSTSITVTEPSSALDFSVVDIVPVPCECTASPCEGSASVQLLSGTPPYTITWSTGSTGVMATGLDAGSYSVTVKDHNGCELTKAFTVGTNSVISLAEIGASHKDVTCHGGNDGRFAVQATGGGGNYEYSIDNTNWFASGTFENLSAGSYEVWARDKEAPRCSVKIANNVVIDEFTALWLHEVITSHVNVGCNSGNTGQLEVVATGGSGNYEYSINAGASWVTSPLFSTLTAGTYFVWVRDRDVPACIYNGLPAIVIIQPLPVDFTSAVTNVTCKGANDGTIVVTASGGNTSSVWAYSKDDGVTWQYSNVFSGLLPDTYKIRVRDEQLVITCVSTAKDVVVSEPVSSIGASLVTSSRVNVDCYGESTGRFSVAAVPVGAALEYKVTGAKAIDWQASRDFTDLPAGTYYVSVRNQDQSCEAVNVLVVEITGPDSPLAIVKSTVTNVTCATGSTVGNTGNGVVEIEVTGGTVVAVGAYEYQWLNDETGNPVPSSKGGDTNRIYDLSAGHYTVYVTDDNDCVLSRTFVISQPDVWNVVYSVTNVAVVGGGDGSIQIGTIAGGTAPYTITWADGGGAYTGLATRTNLVAGDYTFTIADALGCEYSRTISVYDNNGLIMSLTAVDVKCHGEASGYIDLLVTNGVADYEIEWSGIAYDGTNVSGTHTMTGTGAYTIGSLKAGNYTVTVTDDNGSTVTRMLTIAQPATALSVLATKTDVVCNGENNGKISVSVSGGTPYQSTGSNTYTISLIPESNVSEGSHEFNNLAPGSYALVVADSLGCRYEQAFVVTEPLPLTVTVQTTDVTCHGDSDGKLLATVSGRAGGYAFRYDWEQSLDEGATWSSYILDAAAMLQNVPVGLYRVKVTCLNDGCTVTSSGVKVLQKSELIIRVTKTDIITCAGDLSGQLYVETSGGLAPYTLSYSGPKAGTLSGDGPFTITNLPAGNYTLWLKDVHQCETADSEILSESAAMMVTDMVADIDCETPNTGTLSFNVSGGALSTANQHQYSVLLQGPLGYAQAYTIPNGAVQAVSFSNLPQGSYTLQVLDLNSSNPGLCGYNQTIDLWNIRISGDVTQPTCQGINSGAIANVSISGAQPGYTWAWSTGDGLGLNLSTLNQTGLSDGEYTLTVTDPVRGNCTVSRTFKLANQSALSIQAMVGNVTCHGGNDGTVIVNSVTGGQGDIAYFWNGSMAGNQPGYLSGLSAGTVQLLVRDVQGCTASDNFTVVQPEELTFELDSVLTACNPFGIDIKLSKLKGGTGTLAEFTYTFNGPGQPAGKAASLTGMGVDDPTDPLLEGLTVAGTYYVTVYDRNRCSATQSITIGGQIVLTPVINHLSCHGNNNGAVSLGVSNGSGHYTYQWTKDGDATFAETTKDLSGLTAGRYNVVVTDNVLGCRASASINVNEPDPIVISASLMHIRCAGESNGAITLSVLGGAGGYQYQWAPADGMAAPTAQSQSGLKAGTYSVTVTDNNQCVATKSFTLTQPDALSFDLSMEDRSCDGTADLRIDNVTGGSGTYQIVWAGPGITIAMQNQYTLSDIPAGTYTATLFDLDGSVPTGCSLTKTVEIKPALEATYVTTPVSCGSAPDGKIEVTVSGGVLPYTYAWTTSDGGNLVDGLEDQAGLSAGTYQLTVTDAVSCTFTISSIVVASQPDIEVLGTVIPVYCYGEKTGSISLNVSGGSGDYSFTWVGNDVVTGSKDQSNLGRGFYTVTVRDNVSGCEETTQFEVPGPDTSVNLSLADVVHVKCKGDYSGSIEVVASGGKPAYDYLWTGPASFVVGPSQTNLPAGNYSVVAKDANSCLSTALTVTITEPASQLAVTLVSVTDVSAYGESTGAIGVSVAGGSGAYELAWSGTDYENNTVTIANNIYSPVNLKAGIYNVTVTDGNGCTASLSGIVVRQPGSALELVLTGYDVRPCEGHANGAIYAVGTGGDSPYTLRLYNGAGTLLKTQNTGAYRFEGLAPGWYRVELEDNNHQIRSKTIEIKQPNEMVLTATVVDHVECYGESTGSLSVTVSGGKPDSGNQYRIFIWSNTYSHEGEVTKDVPVTYSNLASGEYTIRVIDDADGNAAFDLNHDCWRETTLTITQPEVMVTLSGNQELCSGDNATLEFVTDNWNFANGSLTVKLSSGDEIIVDKSPYFHSYTPSASEILTIVSVSNSASCLKGYGTGNATVVVRNRPTAQLAEDATICRGESATLRVYLTGVAPWTVVYSDGISQITKAGITASPYSIPVSPTQTTTYTLVSVSDKYCSQAIFATNNRATITVNALPTVTLTGNATICAGEEAKLTFRFVGASPYQVVFKANETEYTLTDIVTAVYEYGVSPSVTTTYTLVSAKDANGCGQLVSGSVLVSVNPLPDNPGAINGDLFVCQGQQGVVYSIGAVGNATAYEWTMPNGFTIVSGGNNSVVVNVGSNAQSGTIRVKAINACGQSSEAVKYITVNALPQKPGTIMGSEGHDICQATKGILFSVEAVGGATSYQWMVPAGFNIVAGQGTRYLQVDLDPEQSDISGNVTVVAINDCGNGPVSDPYEVAIDPLPAVFAGYDQEVCGSTATLNATGLNAGFSGQWAVKSGAAIVTSPTQYNSQITNLAQGATTLVWTVTNTATGCVNSDEVVITNRKVNVTASVNKHITCDGQVVVSGTTVPSGYTGQWSFVNGSGAIANANSASTTLTGLSADVIRLRWTLTHVNGCESYAEVEVINNEPSDAVILDKLTVANLCGNIVTLTAMSPVEGTGTWSLMSGAGNIVSYNQSGTQVNNLSKGDNIFRWTVVKNGCSKYDEVTVRNNQLDVSAGEDQTICEDEIAALQGSAVPSGVTAHWYVASKDGMYTGAGSFANPSSPTTKVSNIAQGENLYVWEMNQNGCISRDTVKIISNKPSVAVTGSSFSICADTAQLTANVPSFGEGYWTVVSGSGQFDDLKDPYTVVRGLQEGANTFRWNVTRNGCFSTAEMTVTSKKVSVDAGKDFTVCGSTTSLSATAPSKGTGEWTVVQGQGAATFVPGNKVNNPTVGGLVRGSNAFVWTVTYDGCKSSDTVVVVNNAASEADAGNDAYTDQPSYQMTASPVGTNETGIWSVVAGSGTFTDPKSHNATVTGLQQGANIFRWTVTHLGCTSEDEVTITNGEVTDANAGLDQEVCEFEATLHANNAGVGVGEWSIVKGFGRFDNNHDPRTTVRDLGVGENIFRWTIYYTNDSSSDEVIVFNNTPTTANAGPDRTICSDTHVLEGNAPAVGVATWSIISGGGSLGNANLPNTTISGLAKGSNIIKYEIINEGCSSVDTVFITNGLPTTAEAGDDKVLCTDSLQLMPNTPTFGTGEWKVVEGSAEISGNWARYLAAGTSKLVWKISTEYCESTDTITVVNNQPTTAFAGHDRPICVDEVTLMANQPERGVGKWELITGSGTIQNVNSNQTLVTGLAHGSNRFRWTIDNNGCKSSDDVEVSNNLIAAFAGYDITHCADTAYLVANNAYPGTGTWGILTGSGSGNAQFDNPDSPFTTVRSLDRGENTLTWTIVNKGCTSVSQIVVTNNNPTFADAGPDQSQCLDHVVLAANVPEVGDGKWTIRNGGGVFDSMEKANASVTSLKFGSSIFRWTIEHEGCISFDDVVIESNTVHATVGSDQTNVCSSSTTLEANSALPGIGTWSVVGGTSQATFADVNNPNTSVSNLGKGKNTLRWTTLYKGCPSSAEVVITNNSPSEAYAGSNREICTDVATLDATSVTIGQGSWVVLTGSATIADMNNPKSSVTGLSKGDNVFRWRVQNGTCIDDDEVLIVNNLPSVPYAGSDEELCYSTYTLKAEPPTYGDGLWSIVTGSATIQNPATYQTAITSIGYGRNVFKWTVTKGQCELSDLVEIVNNTASTANAGPDIEDCKDYSYLDANTPVYGTGTWSLVSGKAVFENVNDGKTRVNGLGFGENILQWAIQNGKCFSTDLVTVFNKVPDQSNAGDDRVICENYVVLNANNPTSGLGQWTVVRGAGAFENPTRYNTKVNNVGFGENIYQWTIAYGQCTTQDVMTVVSNKAYPYAGEDDVTYTSEYTLMAANPGALSGVWSVIGGSGNVVDLNFFNTNATGLSEGVNTFRWTIDVDGCVAYDEVSITYKTVPNAGFITDVSNGCFPLIVQFTNYSVGGTQYYWDFGDGQTSTLRNPKHVYTEAGTYVAMLTVPGPDDKDAVSTAIISVYPHPTANFSYAPNKVYVPGDPLRCYNMSEGGRTYLWNFGDDQTSEYENPEHSYSTEGLYDLSLTVTNQYGCKDSLTIPSAVEVVMQGYVVFPNAFKPRPDGVSGSDLSSNVGNEVFVPKYKDVDEYHLQIFDRWGQLIFESNDIQTGWDGLFKGKLSPQDVYVYKSWGRFISGKEFRKTGNVLLVR